MCCSYFLIKFKSINCSFNEATISLRKKTKRWHRTHFCSLALSSDSQWVKVCQSEAGAAPLISSHSCNIIPMSSYNIVFFPDIFSEPIPVYPFSSCLAPYLIINLQSGRTRHLYVGTAFHSTSPHHFWYPHVQHWLQSSPRHKNFAGMPYLLYALFALRFVYYLYIFYITSFITLCVKVGILLICKITLLFLFETQEHLQQHKNIST